MKSSVSDKVAEVLSEDHRTRYDKPCISLTLLAEANESKKTVLSVKFFKEQFDRGSYGGLNNDCNTMLRSHFGIGTDLTGTS